MEGGGRKEGTPSSYQRARLQGFQEPAYAGDVQGCKAASVQTAALQHRWLWHFQQDCGCLPVLLQVALLSASLRTIQ